MMMIMLERKAFSELDRRAAQETTGDEATVLNAKVFRKSRLFILYLHNLLFVSRAFIFAFLRILCFLDGT